MPEISLSVNKFKIKNRKDQIYNLSSFKDNDLIDRMQRFLEKDQKLHEDINKGKAIGLENIIRNKVIQKEKRNFYKYLYFSLNYGNFGTSSKITNTITGRVDFNQLPYHANTRIHHVLVAIPYGDNISYGIIIYENIGISGVKTLLMPELREFAHTIDDKGCFISNPIAPLEYLNRIFDKSEIKKIRLIKYYENDHADPLYTKQERTFYYPKFNRLPNILHNMVNDKNLLGTGIGEIDQFQPDDLKVVLHFNGRDKTIGINNLDSIGFSEYINENDKLVLDEGDLPTDDSLEVIMLETLESYIGMLK